MIDPPRLEQEIAEVIAKSCCRNGERGITGALLASETHLAQYIEGPEAAVADLHARIGRDPRQADLRVIERGACAERRFPHWAMAYCGSSVFVRRRLAAMFDDSRQGRRQRGAELINLMLAFNPPPG